jgi:hypothetical protein
MRSSLQASTAVLAFAAIFLNAACKNREPPGAAGGGGAGASGGGQAGQAGQAGKLGMAGTSGTGAGGTTANVWTQVLPSGPCLLEVADPAKLPVLPFAWSNCGVGCATSPSKVLDTDDTVMDGMASARVDAGDLLIRLGTVKASNYKMIAVRRLSDGALVAAARAPGATTTSCAMMGFAPGAPHVFPFWKSDPLGSDGFSTSGTVIAGFLKAGGLLWSAPVAGIPLLASTFDSDLGWGMSLNDGTLRLMSPPDGASLTTIDQGAVYPAHNAVGWGSLVVSNPALSGSQDAIVRAWEPNRSSRTIVAQPDTSVTSLALSNTAMVWTGVHGPARWDGTYATAELYWTPFPAGKDVVPIMGGTPLPAAHGLLELQTWGDYAVATGVPAGGTRPVLYVVRLSDGRSWTIDHRPGAVFKRLLAVTATEIVVAENDDVVDPTLDWQMQHITRYDLARLDDLAAAW